MGKLRSTYMYCGSTSQPLYAAVNKFHSTFYILRGSPAAPPCTYISTPQHLYDATNTFCSTFYILRHSPAAYVSRCEYLAQRLRIAARPARSTSSRRRGLSCLHAQPISGSGQSPHNFNLGSSRSASYCMVVYCSLKSFLKDNA